MRAALLFVSLSACAEPPTALLVRISVDPATSDRASGLSLEVGDFTIERFTIEREYAGRDETISLRPGALADDVLLELHGWASLDDGTTTDRRVTARFVPDEDRDVCILLDSRCAGIDCGPDDCRAGGCVAIDEAPPQCAKLDCSGAEQCDDLVDATLDSCSPDGDCLHESIAGTDADGDGTPAEFDCDDTDAGVHPGADDLCDGRDENCDEVIDGEVIARHFLGEDALLVRLVVNAEGAILAWTRMAGTGVAVVVAHADLGAGTIAETFRQGNAAFAGLAPNANGPLLVFLDLGRGISLQGLDQWGNSLGGPSDLLDDPPGCSAPLLALRPSVASNGSRVAVAYHSCIEGNPAAPDARFAIKDTAFPREDVTRGTLSLEDPPLVFPTLIESQVGFEVAWSGIRGADFGLDGGDFETYTWDRPGNVPALFRFDGVVRIAYLDELGFLLVASPSPRPELHLELVPVQNNDRRVTFLFQGTDSDQGSLPIAYSLLDGPPDAPHLGRPFVIHAMDAEWSRAIMVPVLVDGIGANAGDISVGPGGEVYYAEAIGTPEEHGSTIIVARLDCVRPP